MTDAVKLQRLCTGSDSDRAGLVREILAAGGNPNCVCLFDKTPLHWLIDGATSAAEDLSSVRVETDVAVAAVLLEYGANLGAQDSNGGTALHAAAECDECPDELLRLLISRCTSDVLNMETSKHQTALSLWLQRKVCQKDMFQLFLDKGADLKLDHDPTTGSEHPLTLLTLRHRDEVATLAGVVDVWSRGQPDNKLRALLIERALKASIKANRPVANIGEVLLKTDEDFDLIKDPKLLAAVSTKIAVIRCQQDPILTLTKIGHICQVRSKIARERLANLSMGSQSPSDIVEEIQVLKALSARLERFACTLLDNFQSLLSTSGRAAVCGVLSKDVMKMAIKNGWDKLALNDRVWLVIKEWWYGESCVNKMSWTKLTSYSMLYTVQAMLLPFMLIFLLLRHGFRRAFCSVDCCLAFCVVDSLPFRPQRCPCAFYMSRAFGYIFFVIILVLHVAHGGATTSALTPLEGIILVYVVALAIEKVQEGAVFRASDFWCSWKNYSDLVMLALFVLYFSCRCIFQDESFENKLKTARVANHALALVVLISVLRILPYFLVHSSLGPMQLSFVKIAPRAFRFLVLLSVFLFAFAVGTKSVQEAGYYAPEAQRKLLPSSPSVMSCMSDFLWAMLGLVGVDSFSAVSEAETTIVQVFLSLWQVVSVLVLLTMFIAVISHAFDDVQNQRVELFRLAVLTKLHILEKRKWPMPLPMSPILLLPRFVSVLISYVWKTSKSESQKLPGDELNATAVEGMVKDYVTHRRRENKKRKSKLLAAAGHGHHIALLEFKQSLLSDIRDLIAGRKVKRDGGRQGSSDSETSFQTGMSTPRGLSGCYASDCDSEDDIGEESEDDDVDSISGRFPLLELLHHRRRRRLISHMDGTDGWALALEGTDTCCDQTNACGNGSTDATHTQEV